ncbi:MAG: hypothetical protein JWN70_3665 [Planctomycetaceae bacterium]|nr:hypothetical protein [Planctomycetaceae bacterium]
MDEPRKPNGGVWITVSLLMAFILYPLSTGPATCMANNGMLSDATLEWLAAMYFPLAYVAESDDIPVLPWLLNSYLSLWESVMVP